MPKGLLTFKQTDLRRAIKAFQKLGLPITGAEIHRDGKIVVMTGRPTDDLPTIHKEGNPWDTIG
jgi:hypothetical protein